MKHGVRRWIKWVRVTFVGGCPCVQKSGGSIIYIYIYILATHRHIYIGTSIYRYNMHTDI